MMLIGLVGFHCACAPDAKSADSAALAITAVFRIAVLMALPPLRVSLS
jgi:hypothetical protein